MNNIEITAREVIVCIALTTLLIGLGFLVSGKVLEASYDKEKVYSTAVKVKNKEEFNYSLNTEQGNLITEGEFIATDPVTFPELKKSFAYVSKTKEVYTMHTREVPIYGAKGKITGYRTEVYWTWDFAGTDVKQSKILKLFGNKYESKIFDLIDTKSYGGYRYETPHVRYSYNVVPIKFQASFIAKTTQKGLAPVFGARIQLSEMSLNELIKYGKSTADRNAAFFWVFWGILIAGLNIGYVTLENNYLN